MKAVLLLSIAFSASAFAEGAIPTAFQRDRYQETYTTSPFALATPKEEKVEEVKDDEFANLVVTGIGKLDDGRNFVVVRRNGEDTSMRFEGSDPNHDGYSVKEVKLAERWGQSSVVLAKGGKQGTVKFNENASASAPPPQNPGGMRPPGGGVSPPPVIPTGINPANRTTGTPPKPGAPNIPRPTTTAQPPRPGGGAQLPPNTPFRGGANFTQPTTAGQPANSSNSGAPRQRVRTINNR